jgi:hypothetical protein
MLVERLIKDDMVAELLNTKQSKLLVLFLIYMTRTKIRKKRL